VAVPPPPSFLVAINKTRRAHVDEDLTALLSSLLSSEKRPTQKGGVSSNIRFPFSPPLSLFFFPLCIRKVLKLLDLSDDIRAFMAANEAQLKAKE